MDIREKDIIVLSDDNHYIVVKKLIHNNNVYYYVSDINNEGIVKFLYESGNELIEIEDDETIENIVNEMLKTVDFNDLMKGIRNKLNQKNKIQG